MRDWVVAKTVLLALTAVAVTSGAHAQTTEPFGAAGRGRWTFDDPAFKAIEVQTYTPSACAAKPCPLLIVIHGNGRNAASARDYWIDAAERYGVQVAAPRFDRQRFSSRIFQQGNVPGEPDKAKWSFGIVERLFDAARATGRIEGDSYRIFGHSAGGQFVHRMALLMPEARFSRAVAANSGFYTRPLGTEAAGGFAYPYSLGATPATDATLKAALARPVIVMLGENDNDPDHVEINKSPGAEAQGPTRFARGQAFMADIRTVSSRLGVSSAWREVTVPGVAHEQKRMAAAAGPVLLGP
ncbi:alpha/beta hydrolase-fold protein [Bosea sp. (in: a-proteobacteria)]|uniref:alpha/beta hydrolase-fold protein n=1 Tax=Bosea sp. (in: a-proteobacteria) TaxID=1871050 RepID=UPI003B3A2CFE